MPEAKFSFSVLNVGQGSMQLIDITECQTPADQGRAVMRRPKGRQVEHEIAGEPKRGRGLSVREEDAVAQRIAMLPDRCSRTPRPLRGSWRDPTAHRRRTPRGGGCGH
jgi:hypothetical protein